MSAIGIDAGIDVAAARGGPDEISRRLESRRWFWWSLRLRRSARTCAANRSTP